jgi:GAF domain-containing protein
MNSTIANQISSALCAKSERRETARKIADLIRSARAYRWAGIYDVGPELVSIIAYSGSGAPAYPQFPITQGLTGAAIREKTSVVAGDVQNDPRYLTAFGSTRSEMIVPVMDDKSGTVIGTIDVESEQPNAFSEEDQRMLEAWAKAACGLWTK